MKIAINGFGRIGRSVYRILCEPRGHEIVALNDLSPAESLDRLHAGSHSPVLLAVKEPARLPWKQLGVDVVVEATGRFRTRAELTAHLDAGAGRVILTVPPKDDVDAMIVLGVNDASLRREHRIISNASCTTNCLAPVVKVLDDAFGLARGVMTTVHAYTNDQRLSDWYHKDLRRSRAAGENTIPTSTGAARAVGKVLPKLAGRLDGMAMRVPVIDGSIVDLVAILDRDVTAQAANEAMRAAAAGPLEGILAYSTDELVSSDIIGDPHSSIFDSLLTEAVGPRTLKCFAWYDNEWGYSNRVVDLIDRLAEL
jgi:glyceraldehyde 3-phosphate dehydrogenase